VTLDPDHFIDLVDGRFGQTTAADLATLFSRATDANHLVVHFHGGLVNRSAAHAGALELIDTYRSAGTYPIFVLWNSDVSSVLKNSWDEIPREKAFQRLVRRLAQLAIGKLRETAGRRGDTIDPPSMREVPSELADLETWLGAQEASLSRDRGDLTTTQREQVEKDLDGDDVLRAISAAIALREQEAQGRTVDTSRGPLPDVTPQPTLMPPGLREDIRRDFFATPGEPQRRGALLLTLARYGAAILFEVIRRFTRYRDHGLYTTIIEETTRRIYIDSLGQLAWELIKRDTLDAFDRDASQCGGTALLRHVGSWWKDGRRVTLVGHSTGAVYIGNLLQASNTLLSADVGFEVVFLAAACSFEFMYQCLPAFQERVGNRIRSFGLGEVREHGYFEVPLFYQGSLLYMVSGMFELSEVDKAIVGMERFYRTTHPFDGRDCQEVRDYLAGKVVWSPSADRTGWRCNAQRHGGFTGDDATKESLRHILSQGFA
jgi:hypothetical protein